MAHERQIRVGVAIASGATSGIGRLATDMGITDLSVRHGYYAHGRIEAVTPPTKSQQV